MTPDGCACLAGSAERVARLEAEMALAATASAAAARRRRRGGARRLRPCARGRLPVVTTTGAVALPLERRLRFLHRLDETAAGGAVAWVSARRSVAPTIPTLSDRRLWPQHRSGGVRPLGSARRGYWPLLVAGPLAGVAGRLAAIGSPHVPTLWPATSPLPPSSSRQQRGQINSETEFATVRGSLQGPPGHPVPDR
jgi:hypothetical protein